MITGHQTSSSSSARSECRKRDRQPPPSIAQQMDTMLAPTGFAAIVKQKQEDAAIAAPSLAPFTASSEFPAVPQDVAGATASVPGGGLPPGPAAATVPGSPVADLKGTAQLMPPLVASQPGPSSASSFLPGFTDAQPSSDNQIPPVASSKLESVAQELRLETEESLTEGSVPKRPRLNAHSVVEAEFNGLLRVVRDAKRRIEAAANGKFRPHRRGHRLGPLRDIGKTVDVLRR